VEDHGQRGRGSDEGDLPAGHPAGHHQVAESLSARHWPEEYLTSLGSVHDLVDVAASGPPANPYIPMAFIQIY
jgi:hypothetical protein